MYAFIVTGFVPHAVASVGAFADRVVDAEVVATNAAVISAIANRVSSSRDRNGNRLGPHRPTGSSRLSMNPPFIASMADVPRCVHCRSLMSRTCLGIPVDTALRGRLAATG